MNWKCILIINVIALIIFSACSKKLFPEKPVYSNSYFQLDSIPESEISVPIQISLKPLLRLAEKNVDSVFTSSNWPSDWVTIDCANRYKYYFRRSPFLFSALDRTFNLGFTGFYKIIGSTRACIGNVVMSPWTPPCSCGFDEGERRVKINFTNSVTIHRDYKVRMNFTRQEPAPLDKCTVCFFGSDVTDMVMKGLKNELDLSKKSIEDSFAVFDLKSQAQNFWNKLNSFYDLNGLGWLRLNPQKIRLNNYFFKNDSLNLFLGMTAKPVIRFEKSSDQKLLLPELESAATSPGFNIYLDAVLNYDSLSKIINGKLKGYQFEFEKGTIKKTVIINDCNIYGFGNKNLIIKIAFSGTNSGIAYFTGMPFYNEKDKVIEVRDIDFDLKTKNILLRNADWMFNKKIINEIANRTRFDLSVYIDSAKTLINNQLNQEWIKGIKNNGVIDQLKVVNIFPLNQHLVIRSNASGSLEIKVNTAEFGF